MTDEEWLKRAIYVDEKGEVRLDLDKFYESVMMTYRPKPPEGFHGVGIGELLEGPK